MLPLFSNNELVRDYTEQKAGVNNDILWDFNVRTGCILEVSKLKTRRRNKKNASLFDMTVIVEHNMKTITLKLVE